MLYSVHMEQKPKKGASLGEDKSRRVFLTEGAAALAAAALAGAPAPAQGEQPSTADDRIFDAVKKDIHRIRGGRSGIVALSEIKKKIRTLSLSEERKRFLQEEAETRAIFILRKNGPTMFAGIIGRMNIEGLKKLQVLVKEFGFEIEEKRNEANEFIDKMAVFVFRQQMSITRDTDELEKIKDEIKNFSFSDEKYRRMLLGDFNP